MIPCPGQGSSVCVAEQDLPGTLPASPGLEPMRVAYAVAARMARHASGADAARSGPELASRQSTVGRSAAALANTCSDAWRTAGALMVHRCIGALVHWRIGALVHWRIGALVHWRIGALVHWCIGALAHWRIGALVHSCIGARTQR